MATDFDISQYKKPKQDSKDFDIAQYKQPKQTEEQPFLDKLKNYLGIAGTSFAGGVGSLGGIADVLPLINTPGLNELFHIPKIPEQFLPQNTHQLTESLQKDIGIEQPKDSLGRILQTAGQFSGQEAVLGGGVGALGGPVGALSGGGLGAAHGAISGTVFQGLKELGVDDDVALGITVLATLSPIAAEKWLAKRGSKTVGEIAKDFRKDFLNKFKGYDFETGLDTAAPQVKKGIRVGEEVPQAQGGFELKEQAVKELQPIKQIEKPLGVEVKIAPKEGGKSLEGRVSKSPKLGETISKEAFETEAQGGRDISHEVKTLFQEELKPVTQAYKEAEAVTQNHNAIYPELAASNEQRISKLESLEKRSAGEEAVYQDALALRRMIGEPNALIVANADQIMKQANSFSQKVKYELPYAGYKGEIKVIVHDMNQSVIKSLQEAGIDPQAVIKADKIYGRFADRFYGDEIAPYLNKKILNPEQLFQKAIKDPASYRAIKKSIGARNSALINKVERQLVEHKLGKYYNDATLVGSEEYVKDLKDTAELVGKEKIAELDHTLRQKAAKLELQEKSLKPSSEVALRAKEGGKSLEKAPFKTPEELGKEFNTRSGIRKIRKELESKGKQSTYEKLRDDKINEIFREGKYESKVLTGNDVVDIINKNHEVLNELLGNEIVNALSKEARLAANKEFTADRAGKFVTKVIGLAASKAVGGGITGSIVKAILKLK